LLLSGALDTSLATITGVGALIALPVNFADAGGKDGQLRVAILPALFFSRVWLTTSLFQ
jgi:hypothetical protein